MANNGTRWFHTRTPSPRHPYADEWVNTDSFIRPWSFDEGGYLIDEQSNDYTPLSTYFIKLNERNFQGYLRKDGQAYTSHVRAVAGIARTLSPTPIGYFNFLLGIIHDLVEDSVPVVGQNGGPKPCWVVLPEDPDWHYPPINELRSLPERLDSSDPQIPRHYDSHTGYYHFNGLVVAAEHLGDGLTQGIELLSRDYTRHQTYGEYIRDLTTFTDRLIEAFSSTGFQIYPDDIMLVPMSAGLVKTSDFLHNGFNSEAVPPEKVLRNAIEWFVSYRGLFHHLFGVEGSGHWRHRGNRDLFYFGSKLTKLIGRGDEYGLIGRIHAYNVEHLKETAGDFAEIEEAARRLATTARPNPEYDPQVRFKHHFLDFSVSNARLRASLDFHRSNDLPYKFDIRAEDPDPVGRIEEQLRSRIAPLAHRPRVKRTGKNLTDLLDPHTV